MPDIREVLKGLSPDDRAMYMEARNVMRRAYLAAHAKVLPIDKFEIEDDQFLDLIDIKLAILFDRGGSFDHSQGALETKEANETVASIETAATHMMKAQNFDNGKAAGNLWPQNGNK